MTTFLEICLIFFIVGLLISIIDLIFYKRQVIKDQRFYISTLTKEIKKSEETIKHHEECISIYKKIIEEQKSTIKILEAINDFSNGCTPANPVTIKPPVYPEGNSSTTYI